MIKAFVFGILALMMPSIAMAQSAASVTEQQFSEEMVARFQKAAPYKEFIIEEPLVIKSKQTDGTDSTIYLARIYGYCQNNTAEDCEAAKAQFIETLNVQHDEISIRNLRIIVRDKEYLHGIQSLRDKDRKPIDVLYKPIGEDLYAIIVADSPLAIQIFGSEKLKDLDLSLDEAWDVAARQTKAIWPDLPDGAAIKDNLVSFQDYEYLPSIIYDLEGWAKISAEAGPDLFITIPMDGFVMAGVLPDGPVFRDMQKAAIEDCRAAARCISPNIYRFRDGRWVIAP